MKSFTCSLVLFCWFCSVSVFAQNTYALIIGISQYKEMPALQYADRDAIAFAEFVKNQGAPTENIRLFLNEDATRMNIVDELYRLSKILKPQDRFYFYFGGHGDLEAKIGHENAMLLLYASFKTGYFQGKEFLQLSELKTWLTALSKTQTQVIFIADACHSGGLVGGSEGQSKTQRALQESWSNVSKILSSQANEFSLEGQQWGGGRGLFSFHLVNGLTGRADVNKNKLVSVKELDEYLRYHVRREASPNVQTPLVVGEPTLALSKSSTSGLAQLAEAEKRNFPVISAVNFKGGNPVEKLLAKLDTGIVELYKQFSKAVKERRLAEHDNAQDNALLHFRAMAGRNIPDTLLNIMKRNLGAALMERELSLMKNVREKGGAMPTRREVIMPTIINLEEVMKLFGPQHYFYNYLQARKLVIESQLQGNYYTGLQTSVDKQLKSSKELRLQGKEMLLKSLQLEPNMISNYVLLSLQYRRIGMPDSAAYFQDKVVELLPNQVNACYNAGLSYSNLKYTDANKRPAPHPKAIEYLERAIKLDSTYEFSYELLGSIYMGVASLSRGESADTTYHNYPRAIPYFEKMLGFYEKSDAELLQTGLNKATYNDELFYLNSNNLGLWSQLHFYAVLHFLHKESGNAPKAAEYLDNLRQKAIFVNSLHAFLNAVYEMYMLYGWVGDEVYITHSLDLVKLALQRANEDLNAAPVELKPNVALLYRELLKALGVVHRALKNYAEAEKFLQEALAYSIPNSPLKGHEKLMGVEGMRTPERLLTIPKLIAKVGSDYHYCIEVNAEMFILKLEQNKPDEALIWYEKALQVSVAEFGNDVSGTPFRNDVLETYKNLDVNAFNALYEKYFPKTDEKK